MPHGQHRPGQGRGAGRRDPGQPAGGQPRARRRLAAAGRDPAVAGHRNDGRAGREDHPAQFDDPVRPGAGIHDLQGWPDRDGGARAAGRARAGVGLPLAGALRAARHSADGGRRGPHPHHLPGRRGRLAVGVGARTRSGVEASITVKPSYGLADDDVARMLQESYSSARRRHAAARAARRAGRGRAHPAGDAVGAGRATARCCRTQERADIAALLDALRTTAQGGDHQAIKEAVEALAHGTEEFAARRMDRSVRSALAGRKLDEIA